MPPVGGCSRPHAGRLSGIPCVGGGHGGVQEEDKAWQDAHAKYDGSAMIRRTNCWRGRARRHANQREVEEDLHCRTAIPRIQRRSDAHE